MTSASLSPFLEGSSGGNRRLVDDILAGNVWSRPPVCHSTRYTGAETRLTFARITTTTTSSAPAGDRENPLDASANPAACRPTMHLQYRHGDDGPTPLRTALTAARINSAVDTDVLPDIPAIDKEDPELIRLRQRAEAAVTGIDLSTRGLQEDGAPSFASRVDRLQEQFRSQMTLHNALNAALRDAQQITTEIRAVQRVATTTQISAAFGHVPLSPPLSVPLPVSQLATTVTAPRTIPTTQRKAAGRARAVEIVRQVDAPPVPYLRRYRCAPPLNANNAGTPSAVRAAGIGGGGTHRVSRSSSPSPPASGGGGLVASFRRRSLQAQELRDAADAASVAYSSRLDDDFDSVVRSPPHNDKPSEAAPRVVVVRHADRSASVASFDEARVVASSGTESISDRAMSRRTLHTRRTPATSASHDSSSITTTVDSREDVHLSHRKRRNVATLLAELTHLCHLARTAIGRQGTPSRSRTVIAAQPSAPAATRDAWRSRDLAKAHGTETTSKAHHALKTYLMRDPEVNDLFHQVVAARRGVLQLEAQRLERVKQDRKAALRFQLRVILDAERELQGGGGRSTLPLSTVVERLKRQGLGPKSAIRLAAAAFDGDVPEDELLIGGASAGGGEGKSHDDGIDDEVGDVDEGLDVTGAEDAIDEDLPWGHDEGRDDADSIPEDDALLLEGGGDDSPAFRDGFDEEMDDDDNDEYEAKGQRQRGKGPFRFRPGDEELLEEILATATTDEETDGSQDSEDRRRQSQVDGDQSKMDSPLHPSTWQPQQAAGSPDAESPMGGAFRRRVVGIGTTAAKESSKAAAVKTEAVGGNRGTQNGVAEPPRGGSASSISSSLPTSAAASDDSNSRRGSRVDHRVVPDSAAARATRRMRSSSSGSGEEGGRRPKERPSAAERKKPPPETGDPKMAAPTQEVATDSDMGGDRPRHGDHRLRSPTRDDPAAVRPTVRRSHARSDSESLSDYDKASPRTRRQRQRSPSSSSSAAESPAVHRKRNGAPPTRSPIDERSGGGASTTRSTSTASDSVADTRAKRVATRASWEARRRRFLSSWRLPTLTELLDPYVTPPTELSGSDVSSAFLPSHRLASSSPADGRRRRSPTSKIKRTTVIDREAGNQLEGVTKERERRAEDQDDDKPHATATSAGALPRTPTAGSAAEEARSSGGSLLSPPIVDVAQSLPTDGTNVDRPTAASTSSASTSSSASASSSSSSASTLTVPPFGVEEAEQGDRLRPDGNDAKLAESSSTAKGAGVLPAASGVGDARPMPGRCAALDHRPLGATHQNTTPKALEAPTDWADPLGQARWKQLQLERVGSLRADSGIETGEFEGHATEAAAEADARWRKLDVLLSRFETKGVAHHPTAAAAFTSSHDTSSHNGSDDDDDSDSSSVESHTTTPSSGEEPSNSDEAHSGLSRSDDDDND